MKSAQPSQAPNYNHFAPFYDAAMGDRTRSVGIIKELIKTNHANAKSILELATGTGEILKFFASDGYTVAGLDISTQMLEIAKRKVPGGAFCQGSMTHFSMAQKYDVVLCIFDSKRFPHPAFAVRTGNHRGQTDHWPLYEL